MKTAASQTLILGFPGYLEQTSRLAKAAALPWAEVQIHRFPDGESRVVLPSDLPPRVVLCRSLDRPNDKLVELALASGAAREMGVETLTLVAPYLCYMRQDMAFHPGEAVSQRLVGRMLADWFDDLITVDPHLHRVSRLEEAVPVERTVCLSATRLMAGHIPADLDNPILIGPDAESRQWVEAIAAERGLEYVIGDKERLGDRSVRIRFPDCPCRDRHLVLVDDVASTGRTLEAAAAALISRGPVSISALVTHALFLEGSLERLRAIGVERVWSSDSIPHPTNCLELASLLAGAIVAGD